MNVVGTRMGMAWAASSIGVLIGSPIAGAASDPRENDFFGAQAYSGVCLFASTGLYAVTLWLEQRKKKRDDEKRGK